MLQAPVRVCFVCSGNICRSPTAEVVLTALARETGRGGLIEVDSAGTGAWHAGDDMDERSRTTMSGAGYDVPPHAAKQFAAADFGTRDIIVALDRGHHDVLSQLAAETNDPAAARARIVMLRAFDPALAVGADPDVGDPYYGGRDGFTVVLEQVERSCAELLSAIETALGAGAEFVAPGQQTESPPR